MFVVVVVISIFFCCLICHVRTFSVFFLSCIKRHLFACIRKYIYIYMDWNHDSIIREKPYAFHLIRYTFVLQGFEKSASSTHCKTNCTALDQKLCYYHYHLLSFPQNLEVAVYTLTLNLIFFSICEYRNKIFNNQKSHFELLLHF